MNELKKMALGLMKNQNFDALSLGVIDFNNSSFKNFEIVNGVLSDDFSGNESIFDLASLTKPLTLSLSYFKKPEVFSDDMILLLNHLSSLPAISRLSRNSYKEDIKRFKIGKGPCHYSDLGALRLMFMIEEIVDCNIYDYISKLWDEEVYHWSEMKNIPINRFHATGFRKNKIILGEVNDDNAFYINEKLSNAGLFSTTSGLCRTLINSNNNLKLLEKMTSLFKTNAQENRFIAGWDTICDGQTTLAGRGCSLSTFGHLGFTGTSIWIDCDKNIGFVLLTNATKNFWYDRSNLNHLRREIGQYIWANFKTLQ